MILELDSIGVTYGDRRILTAASLRAPAGRITALVGRNGAGKTSLLRVAVGLQRPDHGRIRFVERIHQRPRLATLARAGLFYLPARAILDPFVPVGRQLAAVSDHFRGPGVEALAERLVLGERLDSPPAALSAGELRRSEIALACARRPVCLIADEPLRGIDPLDMELVAAALRQLADAGAAVVVTGHEFLPLRALADSVVWCVAGTTHEFPDAAGAWADAQLQRDLLGLDGASRPV